MHLQPLQWVDWVHLHCVGVSEKRTALSTWEVGHGIPVGRVFRDQVRQGRGGKLGNEG